MLEDDSALRQRIMVLTYEAWQEGKLPLQIPQYRVILGLSGDDADLRISNAIGYLAGAYLLKVRRMDAMGHRFPRYVVLELTRIGIDRVEDALRNRDLRRGALTQYRAKLPGLKTEFRQKLRAVRHLNAIERETLFQSEYAQDLIDASIAEIHRRVKEAANTLRNAIAAGWQPVPSEAREALDEMLLPGAPADGTDARSDILSVAADANESVGGNSHFLSALVADFASRLEPIWETAIVQEYESVNMERKRETSPQGSVQFFGNVGAAQFGDGNVAHSIQVNETNAAILQALEAFRTAVSAEQGTAAVVAVTDSAKSELRATGATERFRQLLTGLALLVQTMGTLQPAYDVLRTALHAAGVQLPPMPTVN